MDIKYTHYRLLSDKTWNIIASWKAIVNPDIPIDSWNKDKNE